MQFRAGIAGLLLSCAGASALPPAEQVYPARCTLVRPIVLKRFEQLGWRLTPSAACLGDCFVAKTAQLHDQNGRSLRKNGRIIADFTTKDVKSEKPSGPAWIVHTQMHVSAELRFTPVTESCRVEAAFDYRWYGAELLLGFPVDGDPDGAVGNGRLENAYLQEIASRMPPPAQP